MHFVPFFSLREFSPPVRVFPIDMPIRGEGSSSGIPCLIKVVEGVLEHDEEFPLAGFTLRINIGDNLVELVPCLNQIVFYTSVVHIFLLTERQRSC